MEPHKNLLVNRMLVLCGSDLKNRDFADDESHRFDPHEVSENKGGDEEACSIV